MRKETRKKAILKRKNFFPTLFVTILFWLLLIGLIYFVDPESFGAILLFFIILFSALFFTLAVILGNTRRGVIYCLCIIIFLALRYLGVGNILNFMLIFGVGITSDIYFTRKKN